MEHDLLCRQRYQSYENDSNCPDCLLITKIRQDEKEKLDAEYWIGYNKGYLDGYSDAEKEFMNPCLMCGYDEFSTYVCDECKEWEYPSMNEDNGPMSTNEDKIGGIE